MEQNGYGFLHYTLDERGVQSAVQASRTIRQVHIQNVLYDCCLTWSLEAMLQQREGPQQPTFSSYPQQHGGGGGGGHHGHHGHHQDRRHSGSTGMASYGMPSQQYHQQHQPQQHHQHRHTHPRMMNNNNNNNYNNNNNSYSAQQQQQQSFLSQQPQGSYARHPLPGAEPPSSSLTSGYGSEPSRNNGSSNPFLFPTDYTITAPERDFSHSSTSFPPRPLPLTHSSFGNSNSLPSPVDTTISYSHSSNPSNSSSSPSNLSTYFPPNTNASPSTSYFQTRNN
jgi:hypothetical protein